MALQIGGLSLLDVRDRESAVSCELLEGGNFSVTVWIGHSHPYVSSIDAANYATPDMALQSGEFRFSPDRRFRLGLVPH